jgi:hypothetical protein
LDNSPLQDKPYTVTESVSFVRKDYQPPVPVTDTFRYASGYIFFPYSLGQRTTQWERGNDPMSSFSFSWEYDEYGQAKKQLSVALSRGIDPLTGTSFTPQSGKYVPPAPLMAAEKYLATCSSTSYIYKGNMLDDEDEDGIFMMNRTEQSKGFDCTYSGAALSVINFYKSIVNGFNIGGILSHSLHYYDGSAYTGLALGQLGLYGALVRSETLISTDAIYTDAYGSLPQTLQASPSWSAEYPTAFRTQYPARGGYLYYTTGAYTPGYYVRSAANAYDFQSGGGKGLIVASRDPFNANTVIVYDSYQLLPVSVTDAEDNTTTAEYDYRVLQPDKVTDINNNISAFDFSPLGLLRATALIGKGTEGDYKAATGGFYDKYEPSTRLEYNFFSFINSRNPVWVKTIKREYHYQQSVNNDTITSVEYSDGFGRLIQTRTQAEDVIFGNTAVERVTGSSGLPATQGTNANTIGVERDYDAPLNVVVSGWQVYNNKGKVVEKYEPFFHYGFEYVAYLLQIFGSDKICPNTNSIYATMPVAGSTYKWYVDGANIVSGQNSPQITLNWSSSGHKILQLEETTSNGKTVNTHLEVNVYQSPNPHLTSSADTVCTNKPVMLSVNDYDPTFTYNWSLGLGAVVVEEDKDYVVVKWASAGSKSISVTVGSSVCSFTPVVLNTEVDVVVSPNPELTASSVLVCTEVPVTISANNYVSGYTYTWQLGAGAVVLSENEDEIEVTWDTEGVKEVRVSVDNGVCIIESAPLNIDVRVPASPYISGPAQVCIGTAVVFSAGTYSPSYSYTWDGGPDAIIVNQSADWVEVYWTSAGFKNVSVEVDNGGCTVLAPPIAIEVKNLPNPVVAGDSSPNINNPTMYTVISPEPGSIYMWNTTPGGNILSGQGTPVVFIEWLLPFSVEQVIVTEDNGSCVGPSSPFMVVPI